MQEGERTILLRLTLSAFTLCTLFFFIHGYVQGATIHDYRDVISDSAPGERANHTIEFTTTSGVPAGGYVRFRPSPGNFTIPAADFDLDNVELYVDSGSGYQLRSAAAMPSAANDGISIVTGTNGEVEVTLNSTSGIPSGALVRMLIGNHTTNSSSTDISIQNPNTEASYPIYIETGGTEDDSVNTLVAIIENTGVGPIDTKETIPPVRFNGAPSGELSGTTQAVEISLETDEFALCRYSTTADTPYESMSNQFDQAGFAVVHTKDDLAVATSTTYTFYVRCIDDEGNFNIDDFIITFSVPEFPEGTPTGVGEGENEGETSGGGSGGGESGSGSGENSGSESGNDTQSGGSGGGGGGGGGGSGGSDGGSGGGGFEGAERPYQSGDGRIIVNGYAFPGSEVVVLVDGAPAEDDSADSDGSFSVTLDEIARGVYTIGVYAIDRNGTRSSTYSTTFSIIGSRSSMLSNVNIMPSINVDPDPVDPGQTLTVSGYSIPDAVVTVENEKDRSSVTRKSFTTTSSSNGAWSIDVSTTGFTTGTWKVRARSSQADGLGISTEWSNYTFYGVGESAAVPRSSDLNSDGSVNLVDFSILLFWWNTDGGNSSPPADINGDGNVSLTDFSIMVFNWTG